MREILFRGKTDKGEWVQGDLLHPDLYGNGYAIEDFAKEKNNCFDVDPSTIGQYTGLTDKNGKKIFEGDILRYGFLYDYECYLESLKNPEEYDNEIYDEDIKTSVVKWGLDYDYPAFDLADHNFDCNGLSQIMCGDYEYEVIGNIHDSPELVSN